MEEMLAYCGLVCTDCPAYVATQSNNGAALKRVAEKWSKQCDETITPEECICDGCLVLHARHIPHWDECRFRLCASDQGIKNCGVCGDYPCEELAEFLTPIPHAKANLDQVKRGARGAQ